MDGESGKSTETDVIDAETCQEEVSQRWERRLTKRHRELIPDKYMYTSVFNNPRDSAITQQISPSQSTLDAETHTWELSKHTRKVNVDG